MFLTGRCRGRRLRGKETGECQRWPIFVLQQKNGATKKKAPVAFEGTPIDDDGVAEFFAYLTANGADASKVVLAVQPNAVYPPHPLLCPPAALNDARARPSRNPLVSIKVAVAPLARPQVTLADFGGLRGVMALQDIAPGEAIITVPYELSLDLGSESSDPTAPAVHTLIT